MSSLTAGRWEEVQRLLDASLERPADERAAFVQDAANGDQALQAQVFHLIRAYRSAPTFLSGNIADVAPSLMPPLPSAKPSFVTSHMPARIGQYELTEEVGRGGMGIVYKGHRADGAYDRPVAIKLLPQAPHSSAHTDRFVQERKVLASLDHPNIAQLYDGGVTEDGQLYLVMEFVEGVPITDYCEQNDVTLGQRLAFVAQIAASLQHAHGRLVVHRDIKPSNILATADGTIKLLDFGIAKMLDVDEDTVDLTRTGEHLLTPGFAAPEQILKKPITVATDVYQLGVVLYQLLTGQRPFEKTESFYAMAHTVCNETPLRPSERPHARIGAGALRGDLDAIALKALSKEPAERYASMEAFAADLHAMTHALPVAARRQGLLYRSAKFVRRHVPGVVAGIGVFALAVSYGVTVTVQSHAIQRALADAETEARKSREVARLLTDVFKVADPNVPGAQDMSARQLLDNGRVQLDKRLTSAPQVRAQMQHLLGEIYYSLGAYDDSVALLESALAARQRMPGQERDLASSLTQLAFAYNVTDQYDKAQQSLQQALDIHRRSDTQSVEQAEILNALGDVQRLRGNHSQAKALFEEAIGILRRVTDGNHSELATGHQGLAMLQLVDGDARNAEANSREAVRVVAASLGKDHSYYTVALNGLGLLLAYLERYDEAEPLHLEAREIQRRILGERHPYVAQTSGYLGFLSHRRGQFAVAEQHYRQALTIQTGLDGRSSAAVGRLSGQLATVLTKRGRYDEAQALIEEMLRINHELFGDSSSAVGRALSTRAALEYARGDLPSAQQDFVAALERLPAKGSRTAEAYIGYAKALQSSGHYQQAEAAATQALRLRRADLPAGHSLLQRAEALLTEIRRAIADESA